MCPLAELPSSFTAGSDERLCSCITKSHNGQIQTSKKAGGIKAGSLLLGKARVDVCTRPSRPT